MPKYNITIRIDPKSFIVEAENEDDAEEKAIVAFEYDIAEGDYHVDPDIEEME